MIKAISIVMCASALLLVIGCQKPTAKADGKVVASAQTQEAQAVKLARDYLDSKILGTPGGSSEWNLKARLVENQWIVAIPDEVQVTMPGGFPDTVIVDIEKNLVTTKGPME